MRPRQRAYQNQQYDRLLGPLKEESVIPLSICSFSSHMHQGTCRNNAEQERKLRGETGQTSNRKILQVRTIAHAPYTIPRTNHGSWIAHAKGGTELR